MFPVADFRMFLNSISSIKDDYEKVTFGILIADPRQSEAKEYILNYLNIFHMRSCGYFRFFLPGYDKNASLNDYETIRIRIGFLDYYFDEALFNDCIEGFRKTFGIEYTYNPMLILMSMKPGYLHTTEYIVIELDDNERNNCRRSGILFSKIIDIAKNNPDIDHIGLRIGMGVIAKDVLLLLIDEIAPTWLSEVVKKGRELKRYRIKRLE